MGCLVLVLVAGAGDGEERMICGSGNWYFCNKYFVSPAEIVRLPPSVTMVSEEDPELDTLNMYPPLTSPTK